MNENLFNVKIYYLKFHHIIHDTNASIHQQVPCTCKKMISLGSRLIACCKLAPTLARHMRRHNYVIDCIEYLIFTLSESVNTWVYSRNFCLNPQIIHGDMKENVSGCFFLNTVYGGAAPVYGVPPPKYGAQFYSQPYISEHTPR